MSPMLIQFVFIYIAAIRVRLFYCQSIVCRVKNEDLSLANVWKESLQSGDMLEKLPWNNLHMLNKAAGRTLNILFASDVDFLRRRLNLMNECVDEHKTSDNTSQIETICNSIIEEQYPACHRHNKCLNSLHKVDICRMTQYREDCKQRHTGLDARKLDDFRKLLRLLVMFFKSIYHQDQLITKVMYEKGDTQNNGIRSSTLITVKLHHKKYTFFMELPLSPFDLDEAGTMVALEAWTQCNPESQIFWSEQVFYSAHTHMDIENIAASGCRFSQFFKHNVILIVFLYLS
ncbi:hypothetical protein ACJMK2_024398 [Sinanodonta woodiana]|uniref:Uncharacterized protein n=1 Tax=Sinanodonta woodiana TaxID=1069815 RepID=A0ABD3T872_SINWO